MPHAFSAERRARDAETSDVQSVFSADCASGKDVLGIKAYLAPLAELAAHQSAETPLTIGILGSAGSGKSFALMELAKLIETLPRTGAANSFVSNLIVVPVEAGELATNPPAGLAHAAYQALGEKFPQAAQAAAQAARDPHQAARDAAEKFETLRQKLNSERYNLEEAETRRAKLTDTILYSSAASAIDTYAKTMKSKLETRFKRFGVKGDPILNFKDLILNLTENPGIFYKSRLMIRAVFGFHSQLRLITAALVLVLSGYGIQWAADHPETLLTSLQGNETTLPVAQWFESHLDLIAGAGSILIYLAVLTAVLNIWRAISFVQPLLRGQSIFENELAGRRRELDANLASLTQRVELLSRDAEILSQTLSDAERRIGGRAYPSAPLLAPSPSHEGKNFLKKLGGLMSERTIIVKAPQRIVFALDHLESLPKADINNLLSALQNLLPSGFVLLLTLDPARLEPEQQTNLEKLIQVPHRMDHCLKRDLTTLLQSLSGDENEAKAAADGEAFTLNPLEDPLTENETALLTQFVDLAGRSPRSLKRFFNLYRLCRMIETHRGALALWLALDAGGSDEEIELMEFALQNRAEPDFAQKSPRLAFALAAADRFGPKLTIEALQDAASIARRCSFRL